jgi:hypothetical protein
MANNILLGEGTFAINGTAVALVRGGGKFMVEREYTIIEADGDICPVVGRIKKARSVAKLEVNALQFLEGNIDKMFPALTKTSGSASTGLQPYTVGSTGIDVATTDYSSSVTFTGKTLAGQAVVVTLDNAINLENIDWALVDKEQVVAKLVFTACANDGSAATRQIEPWKITYIAST